MILHMSGSSWLSEESITDSHTMLHLLRNQEITHAQAAASTKTCNPGADDEHVTLNTYALLLLLDAHNCTMLHLCATRTACLLHLVMF